MHLRLFLRHPVERRPCNAVATYLSRRTHASAMPLERKKVGEVFHFYTKIGVAAIRVTEDGIAIGDTVQIQGPSTNLEQTVEALQIEHAVVSRAGAGQGFRLQADPDGRSGSASGGEGGRQSACEEGQSTREEGSRQESTAEKSAGQTKSQPRTA